MMEPFESLALRHDGRSLWVLDQTQLPDAEVWLDGSDPAAMVVQRRASEFAMAVDHIEAGEFPPQPARQQDCSWCRYAGVCRKEYRIDDDQEGGAGDETADAV